jgi:hypothetical protein
MPAPIWPYVTALLYFAEVSTCVAIAQALEMTSHDRLTRMLWGQWSGQTLLDLALRALFTVVGGDLIVDDTIVKNRMRASWRRPPGCGRPSTTTWCLAFPSYWLTIFH